MQLEYGQGSDITEQFAVEFLIAKQARYSVKQFAAVEFMIAKQFHTNTIFFTVLAPDTANARGTVPPGWQLLSLLV